MPFATFHQFISDDGASGYGSCEVFKLTPTEAKELDLEPGWYWWPRFPGCLPDTTDGPTGPFPSRKLAWEDADCTADIGR
jgi:hypothetical protein